MKKLLFVFMLLPIMALSQLTKEESDWLSKSNGELIKMSGGHTPKDVTDGLHSSLIPIERYCDINFFSEWHRYLADCNELVTDTTDQYGIVKVNLIPVKVNGKIMSYAIEPKDTTWDKYECDDYKFIQTDRLFFNNTSVLTPLSSGYITTGGPITGSVGYSDDKLYTTESKAVQEYRIERKVICKIKKRKASFEDFFTRWCVEKKLIEFN